MLAPTRGKGIRITDSFTPRLMTTPRGETVLDFGQNLSGWCRFKIESAPRGGKAVDVASELAELVPRLGDRPRPA